MANYVKAIEFDSQLHQKQVKIFLQLSTMPISLYIGSVTRDTQYWIRIPEKTDHIRLKGNKVVKYV